MRINWNVGLMAGIAMLGLQSCGKFEPLYGANGANESYVVTELSNIDIPPPTSRIQQLIRNDLISTISPPGQKGNGRYRLLISPISDEFDLTIERNTDVSRRSYGLNVSFALKDARSGRKIYAGKTFCEVSYDRVTSEFTNLQAKNDAEKRAAKVASRDIRIRLAAFFASRS